MNCCNVGWLAKHSFTEPEGEKMEYPMDHNIYLDEIDLRTLPYEIVDFYKLYTYNEKEYLYPIEEDFILHDGEKYLGLWNKRKVGENSYIYSKYTRGVNHQPQCTNIGSYVYHKYLDDLERGVEYKNFSIITEFHKNNCETRKKRAKAFLANALYLRNSNKPVIPEVDLH